MSEVAQIITQCGGTAARSDLVGALTSKGLTRAVRDGVLLRPRHDVYTLPGIAEAAEGALRVGGVETSPRHSAESAMPSASGRSRSSAQSSTVRSGVVLPSSVLGVEGAPVHAQAASTGGSDYDEMTLAGWLVLRFAWEHVMFESDWVREVIASMVDLRRAHPDCRSGTA